MARGGARNRSGPAVDPSSARSDARGVSLGQLPAAGYSGEVPEFPLTSPEARELVVWAEVWRTPQACRWAVESWRWRAVAMWVRWSVKMEAPDAKVGLGAAVHRMADTIGLTPAGLKENGWTIVAETPSEVSKAVSHTDTPSSDSDVPARRLRAVNGRD